MKIPSYVSRPVADAAARRSGVYASGAVYRPAGAGGSQRQEDAKIPYALAKIPTSYALRRPFRYSRRRPRRLNTQKPSCSYCGGAPNDRPIFAMPTVAGKIGVVKKNLAPHCVNCGVAVA